MKSLDSQLQGIIQNSISRTMNIKVPIQKNDEERNLLKEIIETQKIMQMEIENIKATTKLIVNNMNIANFSYDYYNVPKGYNYYNK